MRFYAGQVTLPADGSAVVVCQVTGRGALVANISDGSATAWLGGPDVTPDGYPLEPGDKVTVPGQVEASYVQPAPPPEDPPVLYACAAASQGRAKPVDAAELAWISVNAPPGEG